MTLIPEPLPMPAPADAIADATADVNDVTAETGTALAATTAPPAAPAAVRTLCVEGWRGVNHSIAMVNQHQLLALLDEPGVRLYHRDLPYFMKHWSRQDMPAGFSAEQQARIDAIAAPPEGLQPDCLLRVSSPFRSHIEPTQKTLTFMVTEVGIVPECFDAPPRDLGAYTRDGNRVITPSRWSRDRLLDYGLDPAGVVVVPHGVKTEVFRPAPEIERRLVRDAMGVAPDEVLFVNVGVATWNKGLDLLLTAFARLRQRHRHARLLLKDHKSLYRVGVEHVMAKLSREQPGLLSDEVLAGVSVVNASLDQAQMRALYAIGDAYVSPYRAEGFNLPVLEAMACGTPVIVTGGGATDDFCPDALALKLPSRPGLPDEAPDVVGQFLVPDADALLQAMTEVAEGRHPRATPEREAARAALLPHYSWPAVCRQLLPLI